MPRLDLLLAHATGIGRRTATRAIRAGRLVLSRGTPCRDPKVQVPPGDLPMAVLFDGAPLVLRHRADVMLHKPTGCVTALRDRRHPTAYDLLSEAPLFAQLRAVGRLDRDTSGLLLWTTCGRTLHRLSHPRYGVPRTYEARLDRIPAPLPDRLVLDDGHVPTILAMDPIPPGDAHPALVGEGRVVHRITLVGGRFHEVRRIFAALGSRVLALCRTAFGPLILPPDLAPGSFREIDLADLVRGRTPLAPTGGEGPSPRRRGRPEGYGT